MRTWNWLSGVFAVALVAAGCGGAAGSDSNPFLEEQGLGEGKEDTAYMNPDGIEVEVDLEADIEGGGVRAVDAPAELGQFALTYLRKHGTIYLESLAEDSASDERAEWLIDGTWIPTSKVYEQAPQATMKHFRLRGVNAVLLFGASDGVKEGTVLTATVPLKPFSLMSDVGNKCADPDHDITLDRSVYWYLWNPERRGCQAETQEMKITVSKMMPKVKTVYPEYNKLTADKKITAVVLFGQIGHGALSDSDTGVWSMKEMAAWLKEARFTQEKTAPVGQRFSKLIKGVTLEVDLYSPKDFAGLDDEGNFDNLQRAISEHEIVVYDGHSMLGASDFWSRPSYPDNYQIFLYGGCLGYEYYVRPIVTAKGGWANLDLMSSVVEVSATANEYAGPFLAKLAYTMAHGYKTTWRNLLLAVRERVGDSTFGVSGIRDNCYSPRGSLCK